MTTQAQTCIAKLLAYRHELLGQTAPEGMEPESWRLQQIMRQYENLFEEFTMVLLPHDALFEGHLARCEDGSAVFFETPRPSNLAFLLTASPQALEAPLVRRLAVREEARQELRGLLDSALALLSMTPEVGETAERVFKLTQRVQRARMQYGEFHPYADEESDPQLQALESRLALLEQSVV